jgi:hypothetical protein
MTAYSTVHAGQNSAVEKDINDAGIRTINARISEKHTRY